MPLCEQFRLANSETKPELTMLSVEIVQLNLIMSNFSERFHKVTSRRVIFSI